jgi:hypothetical protein
MAYQAATALERFFRDRSSKLNEDEVFAEPLHVRNQSAKLIADR